MRIAILGTRGIPANYGGFETFAEELSTRLVARGHEVAVYCRQRYSASSYRGVRLHYLPAIRHKYFETIAHTGISTFHLLLHRTDVALYCNGANAEVLATLGLEPGKYFLYVSRMEPENHPLEVREAFEQVVTGMKLALVGDAPYAHEYIRRVRDTSDPRIVIPGAIYGAGYREL